MFKLAGCMLLISCCTMLGFIKASTFKGRRLELENIIETLKLMDIEITYKKDPLAKSFHKVSAMRPCWFSDLLGACGTKMDYHRSLDESWKSSVNECSINSPLKEGDIDIIDDLIMGLGKSDSEGQKKLFEPAILRLQSNLKDAYQQEQKQGKMYVSLGTAAGVVAAILLI